VLERLSSTVTGAGPAAAAGAAGGPAMHPSASIVVIAPSLGTVTLLVVCTSVADR
jgi:hypothetical protein